MVETKHDFSWSDATWYIFLATLVATPFAVGTIPFSGNPYMVNHTSVMHGAALCFGVALCAIGMTVAVTRKELFLRWHWLGWTFVVTTVFVVVSTIFSKDIWGSLSGNMNDALSAQVWIALFFMAIFGVTLINSSKRMRQLVSVLCASGLALSVFVLMDQTFELEIFTPARLLDQLWSVHQGGSVFGNPDLMGVFLIIPALLFISRALQTTHLKQSLFYWGSSIMVSVALLRTLTRAAWIALVLGVVVLGILHAVRNKRYVQLIALAVVVVISFALLFIGAFAFDLQSKISSISGEVSGESGGRIALAQEAIRAVAKSPLVGSGPANYRLVWGEVRDTPSTVKNASILSSDAHNWLLYTAAVLGVPASIALALCIIAALVIGAKDGIKINVAEDDTLGVVVAVSCTLVAALISAIHVSALLWVFVLCAMLVAPKARRIEQGNGIVTWVSLSTCFVLAALGIAALLPNIEAVATFSGGNPGEDLAAIAQRFPYSPTLASYGVAALSQSVQAGATNAEQYEANVDALVNRHPSDPAVLVSAANYYVAAGTSAKNGALVEKGAQAALKSLEILPYYPDAVRLAVKAYASLGNNAYALDIARDYTDVVGDDLTLNKLVEQIKTSGQ